MPNTTSLRPTDVHELRAQGQPIRLIDVRTPAEFQEVHAVDATNIPLDKLDPVRVAIEHGIAENEPLYVICKMGGRSQQACERLAHHGFREVVNVAGGTDAWVAANLPVVRTGRKAFALNRQVQIGAGSMVLLGSLLTFAHPLWAVLAAVAGAGLVFSGITNTCVMGTCLAKMPWNQASPPTRQPQPLPRPPATAAACDTGG